MGKLAVKTLTDSDLTLFHWHFLRSNSNQKSINLNANIFVDKLYPSLEETDVGRAGLMSIDTFIYGPGHNRVWNLQRKIIKGDSYKNWRLDGEAIPNPDDDPDRFNVLVPGDFVILDFEGDVYPTAVRMVFVAANVPEDAALHKGLSDFGIGRMIAIDLSQLRLIVNMSGTPEVHPVYELLLDSAIEDAALSGIEGTRKLLSRTTGRRMSRSDLERARKRASDVGRLGEELMNGWFGAERAAGRIEEFSWASSDNAISPFDFRCKAGQFRKIEVKSTCGDFNQVIHVSMGELVEMQTSAEQYDLYRVYALDEHTAKLRIAENMKEFAGRVLQQLSSLPAGVTCDSISVRPDSLPFKPETTITVTPEEEEPFTLQG